MPTPQVEKLKEILKLVNDGLSKTEFTNAFKKLIDFIKQVERNLSLKIDNKLQASLDILKGLEKAHKEAVDKIEIENKAGLSNIKKWIIERIGDAITKRNLDKKITELDNKIKEAKYILANVKNGVDGINGKDGSPDTPEEIRNKIELLQGEERFDISVIRGLRRILTKLEERPMGKSGGGFSYIHMDRHIIDPYTPTGAVNGVNTDFVLIRTPNPLLSLKVYQDGQKQQLTTDYTLSGKTITFVSAPIAGTIIEVEHRI